MLVKSLYFYVGTMVALGGISTSVLPSFYLDAHNQTKQSEINLIYRREKSEFLLVIRKKEKYDTYHEINVSLFDSKGQSRQRELIEVSVVGRIQRIPLALSNELQPGYYRLLLGVSFDGNVVEGEYFMRLDGKGLWHTN